ncbi:hypothetical protein P4O66_007225, partial [Electrophorus voltai]
AARVVELCLAVSKASGGKPTGVLCGEPSAPLRRCATQPVDQSSVAADEPSSVNGDNGTVSS